MDPWHRESEHCNLQASRIERWIRYGFNVGKLGGRTLKSYEGQLLGEPTCS